MTASPGELHGIKNEQFDQWVQDNQLPPEARQLFPKGLDLRVLRQNPLTKRFTLYGQQKSGGTLKPKSYAKPPRADLRALEQAEFDTSGRNPFAPGTEAEKTPAELCRVLPSGDLLEQEGLPDVDADKWLARAVRNLFPYFAPLPDLYATSVPGGGSAIVRGELEDNAWTNPWLDHPIKEYAQVDAFGASEVIIESPKCNAQLAVTTGEQIFHALRVLASRGRALGAHAKCKQLAYFKQYGLSAGGSLQHPHMQVHALPIITGMTLGKLKQHQAFFKQYGSCAAERLYITDVIAPDSPGKARLVRETDHFVASVPHASAHSGRLVIAPKRHIQRFENCTDAELSDLAELLRLVMTAVYRQNDDPHYHIFWETLPTTQGLSDYPDLASPDLEVCFRWSLHVRAIHNTLGITNASGVVFAGPLPEQHAAEYRELIEEELRSPLVNQRMSERDLLAQQLLLKEQEKDKIEKEIAELKLKIGKMT